MHVLVIGASTNPDRYSYKAIIKLLQSHHQVSAIGLKPEILQGVTFNVGFPELIEVDTVSLYLNPHRQESYYDYILQLKPRRVIFNPGTENEDFLEKLQQNNIDTVEACTLVMLSIGNF
jgi:uncharacterized protein